MTRHLDGICRLIEQGAGVPNMLLGASGEGKSTFLEYWVHSSVVEILSKRRGKGRGTILNANLYLTSHKAVNEGEVIIKFVKDGTEYSKIRGKLIVAILYKLSKVIYNRHNSKKELDEKFKLESIKDIVKNLIESSRNDTIEFIFRELKLKSSDSDIEERLIECLGKIDNKILINWVQSAKVKSKGNKKGDIYLKEEIEQGLDNKIIDEDIISEYCAIELDAISLLLESYLNKIKKECKITGDDNPDDKNIYIIVNENTSEEVIDILLKSEKSAIENLFVGVAFYTRIYEKLELIKEEVPLLCPMNGELFLNFYDTKGLFHSDDETEEMAENRILDIINSNESTNLLWLLSSGDSTNTKAAQNVLCNLKEKTRKNLKIIIVLCKTDEFVTSIDESDIKMIREARHNQLSTEEIEKYIDNRKNEVINKFNQVIVKRENYPTIIDVIPCGRKFRDEFIHNSYNIDSAVSKTIKILNCIKEKDSDFIYLKVSDDSSEIEYDFSELFIEKIKNALSNKIQSGSLTEIQLNVLENSNKRAHGNSSNATIENSFYGRGHISNIDENWFVNCQNINIIFPEMLRKAKNWCDIDEIIDSIEFLDIEFRDQAEKKKFNDILKYYIKKSVGIEISRGMFYNRCIIPLKKKCYFSSANLLRDALVLFNNKILNPSIYDKDIEAWKEEYLDFLKEVVEKQVMQYIKFC